MRAIKRYFKTVNKESKDIDPNSIQSSTITNKPGHPVTIDDIGDSDDLAVDTYKIVTIATDDIDPFLIYGSNLGSDDKIKETPLNSGSLMRLLDFKKADTFFLERVFDVEGSELGINDPDFTLKDSNRYSSICGWITELNECSSLLKEEQIFYNFDPYCNFLLGENSTLKDIKAIIKSTTSANASDSRACLDFDFTKMVNPYGFGRVVYTGGGTKGNIYIGTTIALLVTGQIFYLNHFRGSSIGGLNAMVASCITPSKKEFTIINGMTLQEIMTRGCWIVRRYQRAIEFSTARFCERDMDTFYEKPSFSMLGIWDMASKILRDKGLYDPEKSGFQVWYALICLRICQIMKNGLENKIIIKDETGKIVRFIEEYSSEDHRYTDTSTFASTSTSTSTSTYTDASTDTSKDIDPLVPTSSINDQDKTNQNVGTSQNKVLDDSKYRNIRESDIDTMNFVGWVVESYYSFLEYNELTGKTIMLTGTKTDPVETIYYCVENPKYCRMSVLQGARATMSIPWIFKAPIIDSTYHMDGGMYDNYPLTTDDIKVKGRIKHYNNKVFGYLIDDQNSIIDAYEVIRELWLIYTGFVHFVNISYLSEAPNFEDISRLFFEIRQEVYKMIYFADTEIVTFLEEIPPSDLDRSTESYNISGLREVMSILAEHMEQTSFVNFKLVHKGAEYVENCLRALQGFDHQIRRRDSTTDANIERKLKIGRTTDLSDITELAFRHGIIYNELTHLIRSDLREIEKSALNGNKMNIFKRYETILNHLMRDILAYYEVKGTFIRTNDLDQPCTYFVRLLKDLNTKLVRFNELTNGAIEVLKKTKKDAPKNYMQSSIDIGLMMISKIVTRGTGNDYDIKDIQLSQSASSSYKKVVDYFFHTDMTGIFYKYMCIASDRICNDTFNQMRTIKLNTFETNTLHFDMSRDLKCRLIYEGYSKTIKFFANQLRIMELTKKCRALDDLIPSYEVKYRKMCS